MTQVSLDDEPPPIFRGEKEVKKKNKNLPQLVFSIRNEKSKNNSNISKNNTENKKSVNEKRQYVDEDYSNLEKSFLEENQTPTLKNINFSKSRNISSRFTFEEINYHIREEMNFKEGELKILYEINPDYSSTTSQTFINNNNKKENYYSESKEREEKLNYPMYDFDEEAKKGIIEWNAKVCN